MTPLSISTALASSSFRKSPAGVPKGKRQMPGWRYRLLVFFLLASSAAAQEELGSAPSQSRYQRIVVALETADDDWRATYAEAALSFLAEIYLAEADLARAQATADDTDLKLLGWSRAVEQYADQLLLIQEDIALGFPAEVHAEALGPPRLVVAGRSVILNHPRQDQQLAYEQTLLTEFCRQRDCDTLLPAVALATPIPMSAPTVTPDWRFTASGPICSGSGVSIQFSVSAELSRIKPLCHQLLQELSALRNDLRWQQRHGVVIDWDAIATAATTQRPEHIVRLNSVGDTTLMSLPLLHSSPELLAAIIPWLTTLPPGESLELVAEDYGWQSR